MIFAELVLGHYLELNKFPDPDIVLSLIRSFLTICATLGADQVPSRVGEVG